MATLRKSRQTPRVRAIAAESRRVPALALWIFVVALVLTLLATGARGEPVLPDDLRQQYEKCTGALSEHFGGLVDKVQANEGANVNPDTKCANNAIKADGIKAEINFRNFDRDGVRSLQDKLKDGSVSDGAKDGSPTLDNAGVCQMSYKGVVWSLSLLMRERRKICQTTMETLNQVHSCYQDAQIKDCTEDVRKITSALRTDNAYTQKLIENVRSYVTKLKDGTDKASSDYRKDLGMYLRGQRLLSEESNISTVNVQPRNGGAVTKEEYLEYLLKPHTPTSGVRAMNGTVIKDNATFWGPIIEEENNGSQLAKEFLEKLDSYEAAQAKFAKGMQKDDLINYKPPTTDSSWAEKAGAVAPMAGAASSLSGLAGTSNAAAAALPLAAAGAAGAVALSKNSGTSSSSFGDAFAANNASTGGSSAGTPAASNTPSTQLKGDTGPATNLVSAQPGSPTGNGPAYNSGGPTSPKDAGGERNLASSGGGTFIPTSAGSGGSTSLGSKAAGASAATTGATTGGRNDEILHSFGDDLKANAVPPPAKKNNNDGMTEVTNMLGQMKNLFNFDDPSKAAAGAGNGPAFDPMAPPPEMGTASSGSPGFNDGFDYSGNYASGGGNNEANPEAGSMSREEMAQAAQFGSPGTPLFQRVRARHRLAMEKGLVVLEFGRLPK